MSTIRKFGPLFNGLRVLRAVFSTVFGFSARSRRGFRAGLAKWATVGALVFGLVRGSCRGLPGDRGLGTGQGAPRQPTRGGFAASKSGSLVHRRSVLGLIPTARAALAAEPPPPEPNGLSARSSLPQGSVRYCGISGGARLVSSNALGRARPPFGGGRRDDRAASDYRVGPWHSPCWESRSTRFIFPCPGPLQGGPRQPYENVLYHAVQTKLYRNVLC